MGLALVEIRIPNDSAPGLATPPLVPDEEPPGRLVVWDSPEGLGYGRLRGSRTKSATKIMAALWKVMPVQKTSG